MAEQVRYAAHDLIEQYTPIPFDKRYTGIGGSDISAIVGVNPYRTLFDCYTTKKRAFVDGRSNYEEPNEFMKWGNRLEPVVAQAYADEKKKIVVRGVPTLVHNKMPHVLASVDTLWADADGLTEYKTTSWHNKHRWGDVGTDQIPEEYLLQVQWYLGFFGLEIADVAVLIGGNDFRIYTVYHNKDLYSLLLERAEEFWTRYILGEEIPDVGSSDAKAFFNWKFKHKTSNIRTATPEEVELIGQYKTTLKLLSDIEAKKDEFENKLKLAIGDDEGLKVDDDNRLTWKEQSGKTTKNYEAAALAYQKILIAVHQHFKGKIPPKLQDIFPKHEKDIYALASDAIKVGKPFRVFRKYFKGFDKEL